MSKHTERGSMESSAASGLNFEDTALTLRFPGSSSDPERKRASTSVPNHGCPCAPASDSPPSAKAGVVGWPPVRSFRKNALAAAAVSKAKFVKVAVDGALYLRKVDLEVYTGYDQLLAALQDKFFSHFTVCKVGNDEMELVEAVSGTEYVPTYVDKDQDWMLVGDVPWKFCLLHGNMGLRKHVPVMGRGRRREAAPVGPGADATKFFAMSCVNGASGE